MKDGKNDAQKHAQQLAEKFIAENNPTGWFEALYEKAGGDNGKIPWADLEPNRFLRAWAEKTNLRGDRRKALIVGCGLGDDAKFLYELGFNVTAFDISATAIEWARRLHADTDIKFVIADLFNPPKDWFMAFEFVLEVYTIQPLPLNLREKVIDAIANFVELNGKLVVVTRGRENDEEPLELPWALSRKDLSRFETNRLKQIHFEEMSGDEEDPIKRFVVEYERETNFPYNISDFR